MQPKYKPTFTNRPKHIIHDNSIYFITSRCVDAQWFLQPDKYKSLLLNIIKEKTKKFDYSLLAYAILHNHYHVLLKVKDASTLKKFIAELNGASSRSINKADFVIDRKIWWNYYDHVIRDEEDFFKHLNYIHQNPIKHGIAKEFSYEFSSYDEWVRKKGKEYMNDSFEKYPVVDFKAFSDDF
ncbi:MAG: transposase [Candidatus Berkelbacteria bacterium]